MAGESICRGLMFLSILWVSIFNFDKRGLAQHKRFQRSSLYIYTDIYIRLTEEQRLWSLLHSGHPAPAPMAWFKEGLTVGRSVWLMIYWLEFLDISIVSSCFWNYVSESDQHFFLVFFNVFFKWLVSLSQNQFMFKHHFTGCLWFNMFCNWFSSLCFLFPICFNLFSSLKQPRWLNSPMAELQVDTLVAELADTLHITVEQVVVFFCSKGIPHQWKPVDYLEAIARRAM